MSARKTGITGRAMLAVAALLSIGLLGAYAAFSSLAGNSKREQSSSTLHDDRHSGADETRDLLADAQQPEAPSAQEARARAQIAKPLQDQPPEVQAHYYESWTEALARKQAQQRELTDNLEARQRELAKSDPEQAARLAESIETRKAEMAATQAELGRLRAQAEALKHRR